MAKSHVRLQDIPGIEPARWEILEDRMLLSITVYTAQELPVLNNIQGWQTVSDGRLNNSGDVAETLWSTTTAPSGFYATHACIQYHTGTLLDAGANLFGAAANSTVIAVNNSGHLVGGGDSGFWYWNGSTTEAVQPFEEFPFDPTDTVEDMNDGNAVVGVCTNHQTGYHEAFLWRPGQAAATPVGFLPGGNWSAANAINNNDVIVGYAARGGGGVRAFMAEGVGSLTELPSLGSGPEYTAIASDINDNGLIVGYATEPTAQGLFTDGVVWQNGQIFELPWGPYVEGGNFPLAVNNQNQIVGYNVMGALAWDTIVGVNGTTFTFVKLDDRIVNHDDVPAMRMAVDINDAGQILCSDDAGRLYLLTPFNDTIAPTAAIDLAQPVQTTGGPKYEFTIAYTDNGVLDTSTFDNNDIVVTAPDGVTKLPAKIVKEDAGPGVKGHSYVVTYSITPPGGTWDSADDGTYAISVNGDQVYDLSQNAAAAATLGTFSVDTTYSGLLFRRGVVYSSAYPAGQQVFRINYDVAYKGFFATMRMRTPSGKWCVMARQTLDLGETWSYQAVGAMTDYGDGTYMLEYSLTGDPTAFTEPFHFTVPGTSDPIVAPTQKPAVDTPAPGAVNVALALSPAWDAITDTHVNEIGVTVLDMTAKTQAYQRILTDAARTSTGPVHLPANHACTLQLEFADAYHTTNENDIPFTVEKFIETDVSFTTAAGETGPDLTALAGDIALPEAAIPGDKGQVAVLLSNSGDAAAAGKTAVKLYASADNLLDPTDLLLGALPAQAVALAALGQPRSSLALRVPIVVPGALQPGRYRVLVKLEPASAAVDAHVNNNTSASNDTFDVTWKFGAFDAQHAAAKLHVTYGGKGVTLALTGGGYGDLLTGADGLSVALHGTTAASAATITPDKGMKAALAGITSDNGLKSITGKDVSLTGDATIGGALTAFTLADVTSSLITIGAPGAGDTRTAATIALGRLDDSRIRSLTPLKSLSVVEWLDDGGAPDSAQAPWIATLNSTGRKADPKNALPASTGDFQADLLLTPRPQDTALKSTLGTATIAGDLWADSWDVTGSIAALKVGRWAHNRTVGGRLEVRATGSIASAVVGGASHLDLLAGMNDPVSTPAARGDFNSTTAAISAFTVAGWKLVLGETAPDWFTHSRVCAAVLGTVKIVNVDDAAGEGSHLCAYAKGGGEIKSVTVTTLPTTVTKTYPARPPAPFAVPGLELDIL